LSTCEVVTEKEVKTETTNFKTQKQKWFSSVNGSFQ